MSTHVPRRRRRFAPVLALALLAGCRRSAEPPAAGPQATAASAPEPSSPAAASSAPGGAGPPAFTDLQQRIDALGGDGELQLEAGTYELQPSMHADTACALCTGDWTSERPAYVLGVRVTGKVRIRGAGMGRTILRTRAGYGVLFEDCSDCAISGVTVTGGEREPEDMTTDAGIVVKQSSVVVSDCEISDNVGREAALREAFVGISGIVVREGGQAVVERCRLLRNSWDGVAVLRGGRATLTDVVIDGVDRAEPAAVGGGRGTGVRLAWGAQATLRGVLVARHQGGIGVFGGSSADVKDCVIEDVQGAGVQARADDTGQPVVVLDGVGFHRVAGQALSLGGADPARSRLRMVLVSLGGAVHEPLAASLSREGIASDEVVTWMGGGPGQARPGDAGIEEFRARVGELIGRLAAPATSGSAFARSGAGAGR